AGPVHGPRSTRYPGHPRDGRRLRAAWGAGHRDRDRGQSPISSARGDGSASRTLTQYFPSSVSLPIVRNDVLPFGCIRAGHDRDDRLDVAHVEDFVRHSGLDEDEIAGIVFDDLP